MTETLEAQIWATKEKERILRHRLIVHRKRPEPAKKLAKAYNRAKGQLARLRNQKAKRDAANTPAHKAVAWALSQVGTVEHPANSNRGPKIDGWQRDLTGTVGYPWCGAFVSAALRQTGLKPPAAFAYTPNIIAWGNANRDGYHTVPLAQRQPGDLILFKWPGLSNDPCDHVGLEVGKDQTCEGNTSFGTAGSQANGGCVAVRSRGTADIAAVVRPPYGKKS